MTDLRQILFFFQGNKGFPEVWEGKIISLSQLKRWEMETWRQKRLMRLTGVSAVSEGHMSHKSAFIHCQRMFHIYIISNLNVHRDKILLDGKDAFTWQEKQNILEARLEQSWAVIGWADQEVWLPFASSDSDAWLHDLLTCDNMAPKLELPNAAAIVWLIFLSLIRPVEATDVGNTLALVVITVVSMVGFCACLGWYARRRNGQLWGRLSGLCACSPMLPSKHFINCPEPTWPNIWPIVTDKKCAFMG